MSKVMLQVFIMFLTSLSCLNLACVWQDDNLYGNVRESSQRDWQGESDSADCTKLNTGAEYSGSVFNETVSTGAKVKANFKQIGCSFTGHLHISHGLIGSGPLEGLLDGQNIWFIVPSDTNDADADIVFQGKVSSERIFGDYVVKEFNQNGSWQLGIGDNPDNDAELKSESTSVTSPALRTGPREAERDILLYFFSILDPLVIPERKDLYIQWKRVTLVWDIVPTDDPDWVNVRIENDSGGIDEWLFGGTRNAYIAPSNSGALLKTIIFICRDRTGPDPQCANWFRELDIIKETLNN